jgi:hypothetical protein
VTELIHKGKEAIFEKFNMKDDAEGKIINKPTRKGVLMAETEFSQQTADEVVPVASVSKKIVRQVKIHLTKKIREEI